MKTFRQIEKRKRIKVPFCFLHLNFENKDHTFVASFVLLRHFYSPRTIFHFKLGKLVEQSFIIELTLFNFNIFSILFLWGKE